MAASSSSPLEPALIEECAGWIAEQMEEEGYLIDPGLIQLILEHEHSGPGPAPTSEHPRTAQRLLAALEEAGVRGIPESINEQLVINVLEWEDEFLSFAGRPRPRT
jgi:hypothetical protein